MRSRARINEIVLPLPQSVLALSPLPRPGQRAGRWHAGALQQNCPTEQFPPVVLDGEKFRQYDEYFAVRRTAVEGRNVLSSAVDAALSRIVSNLNVEHSLDDSALATLDRGAEVLLGIAHEGGETRPAWPALRRTTQLEALSDDCALERWIHVHQAFFVIIQCMLHLLSCYQRLQSAGDDDGGVDDALTEIGDLLRMSGTTMRLAGAMPDEVYNRVVQPDMVEVREDFSGIFSEDHKLLIQHLRVLRASEKQHSGWSLVHGAIDECYEAHAEVCEFFVGNEPSLLGGKDPGPVTLRKRYKSRALALIREVRKA